MGNCWSGEDAGFVKANMIVNWERAKAYTKEYIHAMPEEVMEKIKKIGMRKLKKLYNKL